MKRLAASILLTLACSITCYAEEETTELADSTTEFLAEESEETCLDDEASSDEIEFEVAQLSEETADNELAAQYNTSPPGNGSAAPAPNCSTLPTDQQNFAAMLNPSNKATFCNSLNPNQRKTAMTMVGKPGTNGAKMTPDDAVAKVMKDNNIAPAAPMQQTTPSTMQPKSSGGCPVRQQ